MGLFAPTRKRHIRQKVGAYSLLHRLLSSQWPPSHVSFLAVCRPVHCHHSHSTHHLCLPEFHGSARRHALSKFSMPAMSPTMTEGGIAQWKKKEGESYAAGDVILEIVSPQRRSISSRFIDFRCRKQTKRPSTSKPRKTVCLPKLS